MRQPQPVSERMSVGARLLRREDVRAMGGSFSWPPSASSGAAAGVGRAELGTHDAKRGKQPHAWEGEEECCVICLEPYSSGDTVTELAPCGHRFHAAEIERWLCHHSASCPACRASVVVAAPAAADDADDASFFRPGWLTMGGRRQWGAGGGAPSGQRVRGEEYHGDGDVEDRSINVDYGAGELLPDFITDD